jgi:hypothetical protein
MKTDATYLNVPGYRLSIPRPNMRSFALILMLMFTGFFASGQINTVYTVPPLTPNNGAGGVTFELESLLPIEVTQIHCVFSSGATTATVWMRVGGVESAPGVVDISATGGWTQVVIGATITGADNTTIIPIPFGSTVLPLLPSVKYGFHIEGNTRYQTGVTTDPLQVSDNILSVIVADSASYGGPLPTPPNNPRRFTGAVSYQLSLSNAANDAGATNIISPSGQVAPGVHPVSVGIRNFGTNVINSVNVNWSVNGVLQTAVAYTSPLDTFGGVGNNTATVALGSFNFPSGVNTIKAWTSMPNGVADTFNINDSTEVSLLFIGSLSGVYTVGGPTADFADLGLVVTALTNAGVSGPVTFNFNAAAGPFIGGVDIGPIIGNSAANTITFNGNGAVLNESGPAHILALNNMHYVTITNFNIINTNPTASKFGIMVRGGSTNITITNNFINVGTVATGTGSGCINVSGSLTSAVTAGDNGKYITISNNELVGGYYAVSLMGAASYLNCFGNTVSNNIIRDYYVYGIYLSNNDTTVVTGNTMHRANRAGLSTFYGIYATTSRNIKYIGNNIHNSGTGTYTAYPIYITTSVNSLGYETEIINNAIYNINTTGTLYGMYLLGTRDYVNIMHNTVSLNSSTGTGANRAIFMSTAPNNHKLFNNVFSVEGAATGTKYCIYVTTTSATFTANYNNYYMGATGGTANYMGYWTANRTTLADWQTANSQDANSVATNPVFANPAAGNATPLSSLMDNLGTPMGVLTDINGNPRSLTTPDLGAIEYTGISADISLTGGSLVNGACLNTNDSVYVTIANVIGSVIDFSINPLTVHWSVTGPATSNGTILVNSGTLAPATGMTAGGAGVNMSVPGDYTLNIWISPNSTNLYPGNDTIYGAGTRKIWDPFYVTPTQVLVTDNSTTVSLSAKSTHFPPGAFYFSELCNYKYTVGAPAAGWPTYLVADDYVEITGVPNSDLGGFTFEAWNATSLINSYTFPMGTLLGPNGTAIIAIGQPGASVPSPANFYYHADVSYTHGSGDVTGRLLKDASGNIVDAAGYGNFTFPAASNVTAADWSNPNSASASTTSGMRLIGPDNNTGSNWVVTSATYLQDPNTVNSGTTVPTPSALTGFTWSTNGVVTANNVIDTVVGPWSTSGVYQYVATYITPCGTLTDTVTITVAFPDIVLLGDTTICAGDTAYVTIGFPGTGPWSIIFTDGILTDTISNIPFSPVTLPLAPPQTVTLTVLGFADASNVYYTSNQSVTITVQPLPAVTLDPFAPLCEYESAITLTSGLPLGGIYTGTGVIGNDFDPAIAGVGTHIISYTYSDILGCTASADQAIDVNPAPAPAITGAPDTICENHVILIDAGAGFTTYLWSDQSTSQTLSVDGSAIGVGNSATFVVTVTNTFGCEGSDQVTINVVDCIGINDQLSDRNLQIYPNPSNGNFTMKISGVNGEATLRILKATGELVNAETLTLKGETTKEFSFDNLSSGIYFFQLITNSGTITEKVMIR